MTSRKNVLSPNFQALMKESTMAAHHSAIGVTALGKANYATNAFYYQAFFALGIGLERSAKLILVLDHVLDNKGTFPSENQIRNYKHDLRLLLDSVDKIAEKRDLWKKNIQLPRSTVHRGIVSVLSDFANNITRYYNLDLITNNLSNKKYDPIRAWHEQVTLPVLDLNYKSRRRELDEQKAFVTGLLVKEFTHVLHYSETGKEMNSVEEISLQKKITDRAIPYTRMYVVQILRFVGKVLSELQYIAHDKRYEDIPFFNEIFVIFNTSDVLSRKRKTCSVYL